MPTQLQQLLVALAQAMADALAVPKLAKPYWNECFAHVCKWAKLKTPPTARPVESPQAALGGLALALADVQEHPREPVEVYNELGDLTEDVMSQLREVASEKQYEAGRLRWHVAAYAPEVASNLDLLWHARLMNQYTALAEAVAMLAQHPDYPKDCQQVDIWQVYSYTCGLARVDCQRFRDQVSEEYRDEPFTQTARRFADELALLFECENLPATVYNALANFATDAEGILPFKYELSPQRQEAARVRALFTAYAEAATRAAS